MTEIPVPTTVRRTVAFSPAVYLGTAFVEDAEGVLCANAAEIRAAAESRKVAVVVDPEADIRRELVPEVLVDAVLAKRNLGTRITDAPLVIGVGPGFTAGKDCRCVVETKRGHFLGRCIWKGSAIPNSGVPGLIGGYAEERVIRPGTGGIFYGSVRIGDRVGAGDAVGVVRTESGEKVLVYAGIPGVVRGLLQDGVPVHKGMKAGDVDPRCEPSHCLTVSDKAAAIGGGVLEAILTFYSRGE